MSDTPCKVCGGAGIVELEQTHFGIPITKPCMCVVAVDTVKNLERGWKGTSSAKMVKKSPLLDRVNRDLYLTANDSTLRSHLKFVGMKMGRNWSFQVSSDADLMSAWLKTATMAGKEIYDQDVSLAGETAAMEKMTLEDLVVPPGLLILKLGVKIARNSAMPEVFLETLTRRDHENLPTWVVDQPDHRLAGEHRCNSPEAAEYLSKWEYISLNSKPDVPGLRLDLLGVETKVEEPAEEVDLDPGGGSEEIEEEVAPVGYGFGGTRSVALPTGETESGKKKWGKGRRT